MLCAEGANKSEYRGGGAEDIPHHTVVEKQQGDLLLNVNE